MADVIATLHRRNDPNTNIYPNVRDTNIPDTILRVADLGKYINLLQSVKINGDGDFISVTSDVGTFTTADISTLNVSGISQFEGKATFGSDMEVDGGLTLNSPSDLHFKSGDTDYTDFNEFKKNYYNEAGIGKYAGMIVAPYEAEWQLADIKDFTNLDLCFSNCTFVIGTNSVFRMNDIGTASTRDMFYGMKAVTFDDENPSDFSIEMGNGTSTNCYWMFAKMKRCVSITVADGKEFRCNGDATWMFGYNLTLETIGAFDFSDVTYTGGAFQYCHALKHIHIKHFRVSFDISSSTQFEQSDLVEIISNLDSVTTAQTLTMGATNLAKLTQEQILVATGKGWTLA